MTKLFQKGMALLLIMTFTLSMAFTSLAAHPVIDMNETGSISITMYDDSEGEYLRGGTYTMYKIGNIYEDNGDFLFELTDEFKASGLDLSDPESEELVEAMVDYVDEHGISGTTKTLSNSGRVTFDNLEVGLYLFIQNTSALKYHKASPFIISVPVLEDNVYIYNVDASPKTEVERKPGTTGGVSGSGGGTGTSSGTTTSTVTPGGPSNTVSPESPEVHPESGDLPKMGDIAVELFAVTIMLISGFTIIYIVNRKKKEASDEK